ncbi:hypothetical protein A3F08_01805 [Candidatus Berkelbacteria bacterium RIFCSPHIGHO2_12_FULL_36_9]|uniref:Uncharacterized protein n=1 Tax=Candidatus Berkelbacteria bacterium RIFCSPHIGHO2_12_FULL_36_9 TaxID=1797469 RepID=A0A1F5EF05_9BACT|nr:MAG: hypothetical protein A3F08_01805 [Candidatus Berkelbacteria bacterium RIFCSPHIGHO2_12_FULL_36_9]
MESQNQKNKQHYFNETKNQKPNIKNLILIFSILILFIIGYQASKNNTINYKFENNNTEVEVIDSSGETPQTGVMDGSSGNTLEPTVNPLEEGPATIEDLGGNAGSTSIDELLKDKTIEVNK